MTMQTLFTQEQIQAAVARLADEIDCDYSGREPVLLGVLTGAFIFLSDLARQMSIECNIDFVRLSSYGEDTRSSGEVARGMGCKLDLTGRHVLVVEEIVDSGLTLSELLKDLERSGAASVSVCTLVDKRGRREVEISVDYAGFVVQDGFLVGYGLDKAEKMRHLSDIRIWSGEEEEE